MSSRVNRRQFLKAGAFAGVTILVGPGIAKTYAQNETLRSALIGVGGRGGASLGPAMGEHLIALCDADADGHGAKGIAGARKKFPDVKVYTDYRKLFDAHKDLEVVFVATPDHNHFWSAIRAVNQGASVYVEKPLTYSIWEARTLAEAVKAKGVASQMGNQGHSSEGWRQLCEYVWSGAIGDVTRVDCWTDRPVGGWRQGIGRPEPKPAPASLDWDSWLGPAPERQYHDLLHPFAWRGFQDFGTGALGDMGCHIMDGANWALGLSQAPTVEVEAESGARNGETYPAWSIAKLKFAARKMKTDAGAEIPMPEVTLTWYDGHRDGKNLELPRPADLEESRSLKGICSVFYGTKGTMIAGCYGNPVMIIPEEKRRSTPPPEQVIPRVQGGHHGDFLRAARDRSHESSSNFAYAGPFTEVVCLGAIAERIGDRFTYDVRNMKCSDPKAQAMVYREPRKGWDYR